MRVRQLVPLFLVACLTLSITAVGAKISKEDRAAVDAGSQALAKALNDGDWEAVASMYTADAVLMPPHMPAMEGSAAIKAFFEQSPPFTDFTLENLSVVGGGDMVCVMGRWSLNVVQGDDKVPNRGRFLDTRLRQEDGTWKLVFDIFNSELPLPE